MYSKITTDNPAQCSVIRINAEIITKIYRILLLFQSNDLNLSEKSDNSATSKYENTTTTANRKKRLSVSLAHVFSPDVTKTSEQMKIALAGVGNPINESVCRVSMLNLANRNAEKTVMKYAESATSQPKGYNKPFLIATENNIQYMTEAGATPKLTTSANESSCFPISEYAFNQRAAKPSQKSNTAAARMK